MGTPLVISQVVPGTYYYKTPEPASLSHLVPLCFQGFLDIHRTKLIIMDK